MTSGPWTPEQIERLKTLVASGASIARASVILKRPMNSIRNKAREHGTPFAASWKARTERLAGPGAASDPRQLR